MELLNVRPDELDTARASIRARANGGRGTSVPPLRTAQGAATRRSASAKAKSEYDASDFDPALVFRSRHATATQGAWLENVEIVATEGWLANRLALGAPYTAGVTVLFVDYVWRVGAAIKIKTAEGEVAINRLVLQRVSGALVVRAPEPPTTETG